MITVTLQEAKATLNRLVERAHAGEDVVLMRGSKVVATIVPLSERDLVVESRLTDEQAVRFWAKMDREDKAVFTSPEKAVHYLKSKF
jgi:antitoxin (DNA-binding transcriptional repressor) of toxin-antitoxin stability system